MGSTFEEITRILLARTPYPPLLAPPCNDYSQRVSSTPWKEALRDDISKLEANSNIPLFAVASLHLFNDDIGSCHDIVQKHSGNGIADYLHYLLHRREGDYWNAKWWIRQLRSNEFKSVYLSEKYNSFGNQKTASDLSSHAQLSEAQKRAEKFVDRCEQAEKQESEEDKTFLRQMQWEEMNTVFEFARRS